MATNFIKPFATATDANVMSNAELANASELSSGFVYKSVADSRLIGKLISNANAGAYAVGNLISNHTSFDADPSNAESLATNLETAIKNIVSESSDYSSMDLVSTYNTAKSST